MYVQTIEIKEEFCLAAMGQGPGMLVSAKCLVGMLSLSGATEIPHVRVLVVMVIFLG